MFDQKHPMYELKVPNTEEGRQFITQLKKYTNRKSYYIRMRGNNPNRKDYFPSLEERKAMKMLLSDWNKYRDLPHEWSTELRIYFMQK